jgi:hypothetical protein
MRASLARCNACSMRGRCCCPLGAAGCNGSYSEPRRAAEQPAMSRDGAAVHAQHGRSLPRCSGGPNTANRKCRHRQLNTPDRVQFTGERVILKLLLISVRRRRRSRRGCSASKKGFRSPGMLRGAVKTWRVAQRAVVKELQAGRGRQYRCDIGRRDVIAACMNRQAAGPSGAVSATRPFALMRPCH